MDCTVEGQRLGEGENGDVPAVVIDVSVHKGQVAAVVDDGLHLHHVGIDGFVVDGAQQHAPAAEKAIAPSTEEASLSLEPVRTAVTFSISCIFPGLLWETVRR